MTAPADVATANGAPAHQGLQMGHGELLRAMERNIEQHTIGLDLPGLGHLRLPPADTLAWLGGLATLAAVGLVEWPVAAAIGVGHLLAHQHHLKLLTDFGQALEEA